MASNTSMSNVTTLSAGLSAKEKSTAANYDTFVLSGHEIITEGKVIDSHGDQIGQVVQGSISKSIGQNIQGNGQVVDANGAVVGKVAMLHDCEVTFRARVHSLTPELFQQIGDLVFTSSPCAIVDIKKDDGGRSATPYMLQVSSGMRRQFARYWYAEKIFVVNSAVCKQWLSSLPREHRRLINNIYLDGKKLLAGLAGLTTDFVRPEEAEGWDLFPGTSEVLLDHTDRYKEMVLLRNDSSLGVRRNAFRVWACADAEIGGICWTSEWRQVTNTLLEYDRDIIPEDDYLCYLLLRIEALVEGYDVQ
ncbi:hypothetical protein Q7P37_007232 [Cladosporium fusiforme]